MLQPNLLSDVKILIAAAKKNAIRSVDHYRTLLYWHIGERIFNEEQQGKDRADYGTYIIKYLSEELQPEYGSGFSKRQLERYRHFYRTFPIASTLWTQLSWSHYKLLTSIDTAVVKFSLPENNKTIMASQYKLILPTEEQLLNELRKELENQNKQS